MTMNATDRPAPRRWQSGYLGAWWALAAAPAIIGSFLLLLVLFGGMGRWEGLVLLGWLAFGAALYTRGGERVAVQVGYGFHRPTAAQAAILSSPWSAALRRCQLTPHDVQLYLRRAPEANAYAAGIRSVAVTTGLLTEFQAQRLAEDYLEAVLTHELGHRASRDSRFALVTAWLAAPWRIATRLTISIVLTALGRQPRRPLAAVAAAGVILAIVQAGQQRNWMTAVILGGAALAWVLCPLSDAAISRRSERAADRYTATAGLGPQLAAALQTLDHAGHQPRSWTARALARHPGVDRRVAALNDLRGSGKSQG